MLICNLPEDILAIVLRNYVGFNNSPIVGFESNLSLLAVCRLWRRLAIPLVYGRHAFVTYGTLPDDTNDPFARSPNAEEPANVEVATNLDLIAMVGCARAVKRVYIDVFCLVNPFPGCQEVIQRMRAVAKEWRAEELTIAIGLDLRHYDDNTVDMAEYTDDIVEVADALAALMPDLRRLDLDDARRSQISSSLYGRLASHYADQLEWLDSRHPIAVPPGVQFTRLKNATIRYSDIAYYQPPQMAMGELVEMRLAGWPANHSWASFSDNSDSQVIEFPRLKRLCVEYGTIYLGNGLAAHRWGGHPWQLQFPSLKRLYITCWEGICPLLEYAVLPPHMEWIEIQLRSATYRDHANLVLPATKRLSIGITADSEGDPSGLRVINRILESARGSEWLELVVDDGMLPVVPDSITCTALTHLLIAAPTSVDTMLALINKLPNLAQLYLYDLDLDIVQIDISVPDAHEDVAVEPLHTTLQYLAVDYNRWRHSSDMAVAVVKYMLVAIPTLSELSTRDTPRDPVVEFVEEYAPRYPHLKSVKLILDDGTDV